MARAYACSYQAFADPEFLEIALNAARFLENNAIAENLQMTRNFKNGKSTIPAFLDDYAFTISAFIELYRCTFDENWLKKAAALTDYTLEHFFDKQSGMFFYTHDQHANLIVRKKGGRRFNLPVEFPLEDSKGFFVIQDRRRLPDRRKKEYGLDDLKVMLTKMTDN